jgi:hypothetical protein
MVARDIDVVGVGVTVEDGADVTAGAIVDEIVFEGVWALVQAQDATRPARTSANARIFLTVPAGLKPEWTRLVICNASYRFPMTM